MYSDLAIIRRLRLQESNVPRVTPQDDLDVGSTAPKTLEQDFEVAKRPLRGVLVGSTKPRGHQPVAGKDVQRQVAAVAVVAVVKTATASAGSTLSWS